MKRAVESFLPETIFDLYQLKAIIVVARDTRTSGQVSTGACTRIRLDVRCEDYIAAQWRLNRLIEIQSNIFSASAEDQELVPTKYGLPKATVDALEIDEEIDKAQRNLQTAISTYRKGQK